jgi:hypothetical protein
LGIADYEGAITTHLSIILRAAEEVVLLVTVKLVKLLDGLGNELGRSEESECLSKRREGIKDRNVLGL